LVRQWVAHINSVVLSPRGQAARHCVLALWQAVAVDDDVVGRPTSSLASSGSLLGRTNVPRDAVRF
jgi:hypothetical protein